MDGGQIAVGDRAWWVEKQDGEIVHLTLVVVRDAYMTPHGSMTFRISSVRSGRWYTADPGALLPLTSVRVRR